MCGARANASTRTEIRSTAVRRAGKRGNTPVGGRSDGEPIEVSKPVKEFDRIQREIQVIKKNDREEEARNHVPHYILLFSPSFLLCSPFP